MNKNLLATLAACSLFGLNALTAQTLLFSDNFNTANTTNFNAAPLDGRLSGILANDAVYSSVRTQQEIFNNQLRTNITAGNGGLRLDNPSRGPNNRYDLAAGAGTQILAAGGFTVSFEWTPQDNTSTTWVAWFMGTDMGASTPTPFADPDNDYGILFRNNGDTRRFELGSAIGDGGTFATTGGGATTYFVTIDYAFTSFANGTNVTATSYVDGVQVANDVFQWSHDGSVYMEFATNAAGNLIDNMAIFTIPEPSAMALIMTSSIGVIVYIRRRRKSIHM